MISPDEQHQISQAHGRVGQFNVAYWDKLVREHTLAVVLATCDEIWMDTSTAASAASVDQALGGIGAQKIKPEPELDDAQPAPTAQPVPSSVPTTVKPFEIIADEPHRIPAVSPVDSVEPIASLALKEAPMPKPVINHQALLSKITKERTRRGLSMGRAMTEIGCAQTQWYGWQTATLRDGTVAKITAWLVASAQKPAGKESRPDPASAETVAIVRKQSKSVVRAAANEAATGKEKKQRPLTATSPLSVPRVINIGLPGADALDLVPSATGLGLLERAEALEHHLLAFGVEAHAETVRALADRLRQVRNACGDLGAS